MGRPDYSQRSRIEAVTKELLVALDQSKSVSIPAGGSETVTFYAPAGFVDEIMSCRIQFTPAAGATSGTHNFSSQIGGLWLLGALAPYNVTMDYFYGEWYGAGYTTQYPSDKTGQSLYPKGQIFDATTGLSMGYTNNSNAPHAYNRVYRVATRRRAVSG